MYVNAIDVLLPHSPSKTTGFTISERLKKVIIHFHYGHKLQYNWWCGAGWQVSVLPNVKTRNVATLFNGGLSIMI